MTGKTVPSDLATHSHAKTTGVGIALQAALGLDHHLCNRLGEELGPGWGTDLVVHDS